MPSSSQAARPALVTNWPPQDHAGYAADSTVTRSRSKGRVALDFGPLPGFVGYRLRVAQLAAFDAFIGGQTGHHLTPGQFGVLVLIDRNPEMTQQDLSDGIGVDKSTLVTTLDRLAARGLIRRVRSRVDRRQNVLRLTPKGAATLEAMIAYVADHEQKLTANLSAAQRRTLLELLDKIE